MANDVAEDEVFPSFTEGGGPAGGVFASFYWPLASLKVKPL